MHDTLAGRSRVQYEEKCNKTSVGAHVYNGVDICSRWLTGNQYVVIPKNKQKQ